MPHPFLALRVKWAIVGVPTDHLGAEARWVPSPRRHPDPAVRPGGPQGCPCGTTTWHYNLGPTSGARRATIITTIAERNTMAEVVELVALAKKGNHNAFAGLVRRYRGLVFWLCFEHTGNWDEAEDLTQEAFIAAYRSLPTLREPEKFAAWLRGLTRNVCRMHARKRPPALELLGEEVLGADDRMKEMKSLELQDLLHRALAAIPAASREVLALHYLGGYSYAEISGLCDLPETTVKSRLHEARGQLKGQLLQAVAELCKCARTTGHSVRCVMERCGQEPCDCVSQLTAD